MSENAITVQKGKMRDIHMPDSRFWATAAGRLQVCCPVDLRLHYRAPDGGFRAGGNLWIFYDIRQYLNRDQAFQPHDGIEITGPPDTDWEGVPLVGGGVVRTFDTHPLTPEFLHAVHIRCKKGRVAPGERVTIALRTHPDGFLLPQNAIDAFHFWLVEDLDGVLSFHHPGGKYHFFLPRDTDLSILKSNPLTIAPGSVKTLRVTAHALSTGRIAAQVTPIDTYGNPVFSKDELTLATAAESISVFLDNSHTTRTHLSAKAPWDQVSARRGKLNAQSNPTRVTTTPSDLTLYWGDIHGMLFNQRPLTDYFIWARDIAHLSFSGGQLFSYSACIAEVWEQLIDAWRSFTLPGEFIALPSIEFATPPDGSHRLGFFPDLDGLSPIFCEDRPEAHDPKLQARYHPETVFCKDYRELYDAVHARGGFTQGHFHTAFYERECLAEIYQKQNVNVDLEEAKINRAIQFQGLKLGIVSGSDTHDSRPANPYPEPGPGKPAGLTGLWAERLDRPTIFDAFSKRRCYATTGARIYIDFQINSHPMGSTVRAHRYEFTAEVLGTADIDRIELMVNGDISQTFTPKKQHIILGDTVHLTFSPSGVHYCYLRIYQHDGHRAWTSPIWLDKV
ncbi:MAG: DUF3604 domain-containing protein [Gemmatimonadetes bacterium]|nr:DUF3604 domain-containing protein [Gemmatimonadota bacterium]